MKNAKTLLAIAALLGGLGWAQTPRPAPTNGGTGGGGGGSGTVTSVAGSGPAWLTWTVTNPTTAVSISLAPTSAQTSHQVIGTCNAGTTFAPCALVSGDLPAALSSQTSINGLAITASTGTFALTNAKTFSVSNTLTLAGTDSSTLNVGAGGTLGSNAFTNTAYAPLASPTFTGTVTIPTPFTVGAVSVTSTGTQINYLNAATGTTGTASTNVVFSTSPTLVTPALGTPTALVLTNATGLPVAGGGTGLASGTSGGILGYTASGTIASSIAGVAGAMVAWGGAGATPTSPLSLLLTNQNSASETWTLKNTTASTGVTLLNIDAGAGNTNTVFPLQLRDSGGTARIFAGAISGGNGGTIATETLLVGATGGYTYEFLNNQLRGGSGLVLGWGSIASIALNGNLSTPDVALDRDASGIIGVINSTQGTTAANYRAIKASAHYIAGTTFTASGCSNGTLVGGASGGTFTLGANACNVVVTMGNSATSSTGWSCRANDQTAPTILIPQSASSTTTATFAIPGGAGATDVINFACIGY